MARPVVIGIDSSTQSTKAIVVEVDSGHVVGEGRASHVGIDTQDPASWWSALRLAVRGAIAASDDAFAVRAIAVGGQQHGLVALDGTGAPVVPASLWNNVAAAPDAERLNREADFAAAVGTRLVAAVTVAKLAHLSRLDPAAMAKTAAVCLPHDYLTSRLTGDLTTDRGEASGSGWWSPASGETRRDLLALACGPAMADRLRLPTVLGPDQAAGTLAAGPAADLGLPAGIPVGPGTGDNMAAALGIGAAPGELVISLGTSGTVFMVSESPTADPSGEVCGFADATGRFLPLACMINCTRAFDLVAGLLGIGRDEALARAGAIDPGAGGLLLMPYFGGERTPNLPDATGELSGLTEPNLRPDVVLRAALDGVAAGIAYCLGALARVGVVASEATLVGGGSVSPVWRQAIADATGLRITVRGGTEHAARGAAVQAAALVLGESVATIAARWRPPVTTEVDPRPGTQSAFRLDERLARIKRMRPPA